MFAEELKGNAARKRQDEVRARRRQLKQQQQKKEQEKKKEHVVSTTISSSEASNLKATIPIPSASVVGEETGFRAPTTESLAKPSAVETAIQQRQLRQEQQLKQKSAVIIQSIYRAYRSNNCLLGEQASLLSKRLKDLVTLRNLILQKTNVEYVPPPATSTVLTRQLLFLTKSIPWKRGDGTINTQTMLRNPTDDAYRLQQTLQYVLLPGIIGKDDNLDPILTFMDDSRGRMRLMELLRLCFVTLATKTVHSSEVFVAIESFLRVVMGISANSPARSSIVEQCRVMLPTIYSSDAVYSPPPIAEKMKRDTLPYSSTGSPLDIIHILRYQLLFGCGKPIPSDAEKRRESCIPSKQREKNDVLFRLTLDATQSVGAGVERRRLQSRFVANILMVPLLTWKISIDCVSKLLVPDSTTHRSSPVFLAMLKSFAQQHAEALSAGMIASTLPSCDVPMTSCPATPTQSLLANIVQIGRICPSLNGSDPSKIFYPDASFFFDSIATLVDAVPLGTFSSRDSAVEWISTSNGHHTPIVLSPLVTDQCKLLLVDSFVRNLFDCAIDDEALGTASVLRTKNDKDLKLEKDMAEVATASATSLATSEAMVDRNKSFWKSSKWARKLSSSMTKVFSNENTDASKNRSRSSVDGGQGMLIDTSSVSKKLAHGGPHDRSVTNAFLAEDKVKNYAAITNAEKAATPALYSSELLLSLCRVYAIVLARWNGIGHDDIVAGTRWEDPRNEDRKARATSKADPLTHMLLNVLCFSTTVIRTTWALTQSDPNVISDLYSVIDEKKSALPIRATTVRPVYSASMGTRKGNGGVGEAVLLLCVSCLSHGLIVTDDVEIHEMDKPLPLHQLRRCIQLLKQLLYRACCLDDKNSRSESNYFGLALISASSRTMRDLYDRSSRRPLCVPKGWLIEDLLDKELKQCKTASQYEALLALPVLRVCPFLVSFKRRLKLFERIVTLTRIEIQGINDQNPFNSNPLKPGIPVRIMRTRLLEDGLATMNNLGQNMRQRIVVHYTNEAGVQEIGIDAGGLFKEFWTDLSQLAFDPNYALFRVTEGNCLYPNPSSFAAHGSDHITLFEFLGRILGKSLFEGITVHPQFAHFFLSFLRGEYNFLHQFSDLSTMDVQLYNNLMFLKTYEGDAEELCLTFTVANDDFGGNKEVALIPNGADIVVTNANKHRYIGLVAKHHVCDRVRVQSEAFRRGLWEVISPSWLRIFNEPELQVLISGPSDGKIDIDDMRSNSRYAGGYTPIDRNVVRFWKVVGSLSNKQQAALLRFVTSCERPPPLGFSTLNPPFTIQRVGILRDGDKLPSASTCFNVLKLPTYSSEKVLRQRLIYAIESGAGFELT